MYIIIVRVSVSALHRTSQKHGSHDAPLARHGHDAHHVLGIAVDLGVEDRLCAVELRRPPRQAVVGVYGEARVVEQHHRGLEHGCVGAVVAVSRWFAGCMKSSLVLSVVELV